MRYLVYRCRNPLRAARSYQSELYAPVEREKLPEGGIKHRPALPGYLFGKVGFFIPADIVWWYGVKPLTDGKNQWTVKAKDLAEVQRRLNAEFLGNPPDPPIVYDFQPGDSVKIFEGHLFGGSEAVFAEYKGGDRGRVRTSFGYIDIGLQFLVKERG